MPFEKRFYYVIGMLIAQLLCLGLYTPCYSQTC